ncbi:MAG: Fic family protein [Actinobacteria bacterium]|jgi:Fic family protein|nr:MAG: Fic family protein [Actinomycetota bacterium]
MNTLSLEYIGGKLLPQQLLKTIRLIGEYKGRQDLFKAQAPQMLESLRQVAMVQSVESSNRIEGITAPHERILALVGEKTSPKDRSEQEIAGYRDVLNSIHANYKNMELSEELILGMHKDLYGYLPDEGGFWKRRDNRIVQIMAGGSVVVRFDPVAASETKKAMADLQKRFEVLWRSGEVEPLLLIASYVFDFSCIHPFQDGNGRMARLLTLLLLYKQDYEVGRYISLEKVVEQTKDSYYRVLYTSSQGWHEKEHDILPWWEYFIGVMLLSSYREFEERVGVVSSSRGTKTAMVLDVINGFAGEFTFADLKERCPTVSVDMIRKVLKDERGAGNLECRGKGPGARWRNT